MEAQDPSALMGLLLSKPSFIAPSSPPQTSSEMKRKLVKVRRSTAAGAAPTTASTRPVHPQQLPSTAAAGPSIAIWVEALKRQDYWFELWVGLEFGLISSEPRPQLMMKQKANVFRKIR